MVLFLHFFFFHIANELKQLDIHGLFFIVNAFIFTLLANIYHLFNFFFYYIFIIILNGLITNWLFEETEIEMNKEHLVRMNIPWMIKKSFNIIKWNIAQKCEATKVRMFAQSVRTPISSLSPSRRSKLMIITAIPKYYCTELRKGEKFNEARIYGFFFFLCQLCLCSTFGIENCVFFIALE